MKYPIITAIYYLLFALATICHATENTPEALFESANQDVVQGNYAEAIHKYHQIAGKVGVSAPLLFNLAGSYAASGQTGKAVLNYERALRLDPGSEEIKATLEQVREDAGLYRDSTPTYERYANLLEADQWLMISAAALILLSLTMLASASGKVALLASQSKWITACSLFILLLSLPPALLCYTSWNSYVVTGQDATLQLSPFAHAAPTGTISQGRLVKKIDQHEHYLLVEDFAGQHGWLEQDKLEKITDISRLTNSKENTMAGGQGFEPR